MKLNLFSDLVNLFYPKLCAHCNFPLLNQEFILCTLCKHELPQLPIENLESNVITEIFYGKIPIKFGFSLLIYRRDGMVRNLIHELKYKGDESIGEWLGDWTGMLLKNTPEFATIDFIIPVPLHYKKMKSRGYNQVSKFAKQLGKHLKIPVMDQELKRISATKTQTFKARFERFSNVNTKFALDSSETFENKHILLVDDVITTGATLEACANLFSAINQCTVSIVSMAYTE